VLKDISWCWTPYITGLLLFLVLFFNQSGYITGKNYYSIISNDIWNTWCYNVITDINPWNSFIYSCTERYFMGLNTLLHWFIVVFGVVL
jgi:hypothetical protein